MAKLIERKQEIELIKEYLVKWDIKVTQVGFKHFTVTRDHFGSRISERMTLNEIKKAWRLWGIGITFFVKEEPNG